MSKIKEYDYETIIKENEQQVIDLEVSEAKMKTAYDKYKTLGIKYANINSSHYNQKIKTHKLKTEDMKNLNLESCFLQESVNMDTKLSAVQNELKNLREKTLQEIEIFRENMNKITQKYETLPIEFDNTTLLNEIEKSKKAVDELKKQIKCIEEKQKEKLTNIKSNEYTAKPNLKNLTQTLQEESLKLYGNKDKLQKQYTDTTTAIKYLGTKINELNI